MRGDIKLIRGLGVSAVALLLLVGGVTAASPGAESRVEPTATSTAECDRDRGGHRDGRANRDRRGRGDGRADRDRQANRKPPRQRKRRSRPRPRSERPRRRSMTTAGTVGPAASPPVRARTAGRAATTRPGDENDDHGDDNDNQGENDDDHGDEDRWARTAAPTQPTFDDAAAMPLGGTWPGSSHGVMPASRAPLAMAAPTMHTNGARDRTRTSR